MKSLIIYLALFYTAVASGLEDRNIVVLQASAESKSELLKPLKALLVSDQFKNETLYMCVYSGDRVSLAANDTGYEVCNEIQDYNSVSELGDRCAPNSCHFQFHVESELANVKKIKEFIHSQEANVFSVIKIMSSKVSSLTLEEAEGLLRAR